MNTSMNKIMNKKAVGLTLVSLLSLSFLGGCMPEEKQMAPGDDTPKIEENKESIIDDERDIKGEDGTYLGTLDVKEG